MCLRTTCSGQQHSQHVENLLHRASACRVQGWEEELMATGHGSLGLPKPPAEPPAQMEELGRKGGAPAQAPAGLHLHTSGDREVRGVRFCLWTILLQILC
jgi:hypothetical protein